MVWNIHFQVAALLIASVVLGMCLSQKRLNFSAERAYTRLLYIVIVSIVFDISSIFAINYRFQIGLRACEVVCKLYLLSITMVGCQAAWFAVAEIRYTFKKFWVRITAAPVFVVLIVLFSFPIQIESSSAGIYTYGIPVLITYAFNILYIVSTFVMTLVLRDKINKKRRIAIYFWMGCWAGFATLQFFYNNLLVVSFAMALALMYMYCKLENPEYHLDFATNVFNKKGFHQIMTEHIKYHEERSIVSFAIGDLNMVNEVFGARIVEKLVLAISEFADGIPNSTLFRVEDNLFCISVEDVEEGEKALEQLIRRFELPWMIAGASVEIGISLTFIDKISSFKEVEALEETIHYFVEESKKLQPGEVLYVNEAELKHRQRSIEMQHALEWALHNDGVEMYYQPIYNIADGKFSAVEALARIRDSAGNLIMPSEFIEFAEKNGMILRLGEIVFRKTCEFIQRMHIEDHGIEFVEVNLSAVQCMQEDMARTLKNIMGEYQIPPYRINFEITETAATSLKKTVERNMNDLIAYGSGFSLDDYGSGYSNLVNVLHMPLKIIKLDKTLVDSYFTSERVRIATEYTIEMIHKLGLSIVVEGVETEEQYLVFKGLGVEYIQGYYFSKPLPRNQVLNYIQEWL